jgi:hypothetical protein
VTTTTTRSGTGGDAAARLVLDDDAVAALRCCDAVDFHHTKAVRFIRATLDAIPSSRVYTSREQRLFPEVRDTGAGDRARIIPVVSSVHGFSERNDGETWTRDEARDVTCSALISSAHLNPLWPTLAATIRRGDVLHLLWTANDDTELLRSAGLRQDYLRLRVIRGERELTFGVIDQVGPANSVMRMIRRHG